MVIAAVVAGNRGENVGTALLLTLFLGWIGLAIVVFGQNRAAATAGALATAAGSASTTVHAGADVVANRLRRIDDLHAQGLITDEERAEQRASVLNDL